MTHAASRAATAAIYGLTLLAGIAAFLAPFVLPQPASAQENLTPLLTVLLLVISLMVLLIEVQGQVVSAKVVAALGILVAMTAVLRFIEVSIPGPGGFSPIFAPIILAGYVFGARFGFLLGAMALLLSALITGGVGPWLPYQMFTAGWVGMSSGWLPRLKNPRQELALLLAWGFFWGLLYGAIMNLYTWPLLVGTAVGWQPGLGFADVLARYATFYLATSLAWDMGAAIGNVLLLLILGTPAIRALQRFRQRFQYQVIGPEPGDYPSQAHARD